MSNERNLIPQDPEYFHAVGLAVVAFARLEWDVAWCCERLEPGYIATIDGKKKKTATTVGKEFKTIAEKICDSVLSEKVVRLADEFIALAECRNGLLHGKPGTATDHDQRLFRHGVEWDIHDVDNFSDHCVRASVPLNALLYNELQDGHTVSLNP